MQGSEKTKQLDDMVNKDYRVVGLWVLSLFRRGRGQQAAFNLRRLAFGLLFWIWFAFVAKVYVAEFINYHPGTGFLNHVLVQFPCFDFVPFKLVQAPA